MHARRKGQSGSTRLNRKDHPQWSSLNPREIESRVIELAKSGKSTSEIGMVLRDQYAVPDVKVATKQKVTRILEKNNIRSEIPEDLRNLINRTQRLRNHLETHRRDLKNKRNLQLTEAKIWRLTRYYHLKKRLPKDWRYSAEQAKLMFE
jgi:small subunit ribosomal protein S15